ncbi:hypothetical protein ACHQM5_015685 [Ranunculus cassubicifolius]
MEAVGTMCEGEWTAFGGVFSNEEASFMAQFIGNYPFPSEGHGGMSLETSSSTFWQTHEPVTNATGFDENVYFSQDISNSNSCYFSTKEGSYSDSRDNSTSFHVSPSMDSSYLQNPMEYFCMADEQNPSLMHDLADNALEEVPRLKGEMSSNSLEEAEEKMPNAAIFSDPKLHLKRKSKMAETNAVTENEDYILSENPKKKARVSGSVRKNKKNVESKKNQGVTEISKNEEGANNADTNGQSSSSCNSEDGSQEISGVETSKGSESADLCGKTRAGRGSATDPQSIYARKRRERINERLRILQNLVPNGTKVDISTMLEEAVQYVKFLQVQIKLLSSDDLWMYAPLAYNGMDIGLDLRVSLPR